MAKLAFLGLGVMGYPMAGHLKAAGHEVTVYNRTTAKAEAWATEHGGSFATTPREAADGAEFVMACVGNDDDLRSVVLGDDGALAGMSSGAIFVDHTTVSALVTRELADVAADAGIGWVDAPVSGGQAGAENGQLVVMCGGAEDHFAAAEPVIDAYSKLTERFGDVGSGQITKMVNQICIVGAIQSISEGLYFAKTAGLDAKKVAALVPGRGRVLAARQPGRDDDRQPFQARLRRRLDAQGPRHRAGTGQGDGPQPSRHRARRSVLRRGAAAGRRALGHLQPHPALPPDARRRDLRRDCPSP
jgi:3-hydroxyisobutyrate dehydrogenase